MIFVSGGANPDEVRRPTGSPQEPHRRVRMGEMNLGTVKRITKHEKKMKWLGENQAYLEATYPGRWVAVADEGLVGVGKTLAEAEDAALERGFSETLVTGVKSKEYQGVYLIR